MDMTCSPSNAVSMPSILLSMLQCTHAIIVFFRHGLIGMRSIVGCLKQKDLEKGEDVVKLKATNSVAMELEGERRYATHILDCIMARLGVKDAYVEMWKGNWRDPGPCCRT